jgi:hypothetical protein
MLRLLAGLAALAVSATGLAAETTSSSSSSAAVATTLVPGKPYEACMTLAAGDQRRWYFKADGPLDFDIHYQDGDKVAYAMKRGGMRGDGGTFVAKSAQDYCWTWAASKPVRLEARIQP